MSKGSIIKNTFRTYKDEHTNNLVTCLTDTDYLCHHPYFYNKMFTKDGTCLIYVMEVNGIRELYKLDFINQCSIQLTEGGGLCDYSANLSQDDKYLFYCKNKAIVRMNMVTLEEETIYQTANEWWAYDNPAFSADNKYAITIEMLEEDRLQTSGGWEVFEAQWEKNPTCRLVYIDIESKTSRIIYEDHCWLGHPQIRPYHNNIVSFCHEGPSHRIDARLWLINDDGTNMHCARKQNKGDMITHEFWLQDGSRMSYIYRKQNQDGKNTDELVDPETFMPKISEAELKQTIMFLNTDTLEELSYMECSKYCHCISDNQNQRIVGDGQLPDEAFIYLVDIAEKSERKLCYHGSSWRSYGTNQDSHPHPAFTPNGNKVVFTSDKDGLPAIYIIDISTKL